MFYYSPSLHPKRIRLNGEWEASRPHVCQNLLILSTLNKIFSVTYYLELHISISYYIYIFNQVNILLIFVGKKHEMLQ